MWFRTFFLVGYFTTFLVFALHSIKQQDLEHFEGIILGPVKVLSMHFAAGTEKKKSQSVCSFLFSVSTDLFMVHLVHNHS
jgi:hypothetical protein